MLLSGVWPMAISELHLSHRCAAPMEGLACEDGSSPAKCLADQARHQRTKGSNRRVTNTEIPELPRRHLGTAYFPPNVSGPLARPRSFRKKPHRPKRIVPDPNHCRQECCQTLFQQSASSLRRAIVESCRLSVADRVGVDANLLGDATAHPVALPTSEPCEVSGTARIQYVRGLGLNRPSPKLRRQNTSPERKAPFVSVSKPQA